MARATQLAIRAQPVLAQIFFALAYLFLSLSLASAQPYDVGQRIRSEHLEEQVLIPVQIETSLKELNSQPKEVNLQTILAPYAGSRTQVQAALNLLGNRGGSPSDLSVSVRLLNSRFFDDVMAREYRDRIATFAYTGCRRDGYKFFQQSGYAPIRHDLWQAACDGDGEESERVFAEARAGGEVVLLDGDGKLYRLTKDFFLTKLPGNGIDGVALLGGTAYGAITDAGQTLGSFVSSDNASTFDLSEAIPSIYAFSLRHKGDESPGTTLQYYVSIGILSPQGDNAEPLFSPAAIIPIQVAVEADTENCRDGVDNDSDGMIDCGDSDCSGSGNCITPAEDCYNSADDDTDGAADCSDSDCASLPSCAPPVEICDNGLDDDSNGSSDCADPNCSGSPSCLPPPEDCTNGTDDDGDGYTDCSDSDCQNTYTCTACSAECPYGGGSCSCSNSWLGWGACSCDCSTSCPPPPQNPEFLTLSESQSYSLGCYSDQFSFQARLPVYGDYVVYVDGQNVRNLGWTSGDQSVSLSISPGYHQITLVNQSGGGSASVHISTYYSCDSENCSDGYDNNGNGAVDCSDPECSGYWACYSMPENCSDGIDNDNDGAIDCSDYYDCSSASNCTTQPEYCYDGYDNDGDGAADCNDSDCPGCIVYYEQCDNYTDDDYDGLVDCSDPDCSTDYRCHPPREYDCANNADDDWDWMIDCTDPDCAGHEVCINPSEICDDTVDNDGDGLIDCEDVEQCACADIELCSREGDEDGNGYADCRDRRCEFYPACGNVIHEVCDNAIDDDDNGETDCYDYWCRERAVCIPTEDCANPGDDDGDGAADCDDSDCSSADNCVEKVEDCANGEDDDGDDRIDADDPSCRGSEVIPAEGTPLASFDPIFGIRISEDTTQIASITEWVWRLEALPPREEGGPAADVEPQVLNAVYVEVRDGVIEGFFAYEERGVFREYLTPNTRYRLTVSLRGLDVNGVESIVADQQTIYFITPDVAVLPDGVALVRHDIVLSSRAVPTATPTETATPTPPTSESECADGVDNDGDGQSDCLDMDCNGNSACYTCVSTGGESCGNGFDDDCDGATDCGDGDCSESVECENGGNTGGTTGGTMGGSPGTTPPSPNIPFVRNIIEKGNIGIVCGDKTFEAEVALPQGGASDRLTLVLSEMYYTAQKDPKTGAMIGVPQYRAIQSESLTSFPQQPVVLRFNSGAGTYRLELVNYLGARSYQTIINFYAEESCAPTPTPTEGPEEPTPTPDPTDTPEPTPTPTPTPKQDDEDSENLCGNGTKDPGEQCDPGGSTSECGEKAFCDPTSCACRGEEKKEQCCYCLYVDEFSGDCQDWLSKQKGCTASYVGEVSDAAHTFASFEEFLITVCGGAEEVKHYEVQHGSPEDVCNPFEVAYTISETLPAVKKIDVTRDSCLVFDNPEQAEQYAQMLAKEKPGTDICVTSNQNVTSGNISASNSYCSPITFQICSGEACKVLHPCHPEGSNCWTHTDTLDTFECRDAAGNKRTQVCVAKNGDENSYKDGTGDGTWKFRK